MRPTIEPVTRAGKPYFIGLLVDANDKELARAFSLRDNEAQARGDAAALMRDWLASRVKRIPRHPEEPEPHYRDAGELAAWDAGVPLQGPL